MEIKRGNWRIVLLIPILGLAIKFPRIYWRKAWRQTGYMISHPRWIYLELFEYNVYTYGVLKQWLFKGMYESWKEYRFYRKTKHPFCVPTYFSCFGLLNVQQLVQPCNFDGTDIFCQLQELADMALIKLGSHHWTEPANFTFVGQKLRIADYGDPKVQKAILEYGQKIQDNFDPNYSWDKRREELEAERKE